MACCDNHAAPGLVTEDPEADHGRGDDAVGKERLDAVGGAYLGDLGGEFRGAEPAVVPNDEPAARLPSRFQQPADALRTRAHILEGVVPGDERPPAIGAEPDGGGVGRHAI